jgi:hypothetical protein
MDVIIVSKTQMSNAACVGGVLANGRFVRLLNSDGYNQSLDTTIQVGEVYTISFSERIDKKPPHIEDIIVNSITYKFTFGSTAEMVDYLKDKLNVKIWKGSSDVLFEGKLQWTSGGSGYISKDSGIPNCSVGFWIPDKDLTRKDFNEKVRYSYPLKWRNISFVGFQNPVNLIPANSLVRVSLARWWSNNNDEERCYLQLSGWYDLPQSIPPIIDEFDDLDLPF